MVVVSGTKLAAEIDVSRSAVWRMVQQLRGYGVPIEGHPTTGYALKQVPDLLLPDALEPQLKPTIFSGKVQHRFRTASTNADAMQAAARGAPEGTVFVAEEQTAGRGRGGHSWHSAKGQGIYCSVILRPQMPPADVLILSLATGLAAHAAVQQVTGSHPDLRWPNDLLLNRKKFCGILAEMNAEATRVRYVVVGIGMNVNHLEFPRELRDEATSLRLANTRVAQPPSAVLPRSPLLAALLKSLDREYRDLQPAGIIARFMENSSMARGRRVHVEEHGGYEGVTEGLDERGFLRVCTREGLRTVLSGGVRATDE